MAVSTALCFLVSLVGVLGHWKEADESVGSLSVSPGAVSQDGVSVNNESSGDGEEGQARDGPEKTSLLTDTRSGGAHAAALHSWGDHAVKVASWDSSQRTESLASLSTSSTQGNMGALKGEVSSPLDGRDEIMYQIAPTSGPEMKPLSRSVYAPSMYVSSDDPFGAEPSKDDKSSGGSSSESSSGVIDADDLSTVMLVMVCFIIALAIVVSVFASVAIMCRYNVNDLRGLHGSARYRAVAAARDAREAQAEHKRKYGSGRILSGATVHGVTLSSEHANLGSPSIAPPLYAVGSGVLGAHSSF